jgi:P-type E1-E2 ATPase
VNGAPIAQVVAAACVGALACATAKIAAIVGLAHAEGHAQALAHGIVYKDAAGFDRAGRTDVAVVCSRGTVLMGEPEIVALEPLGAFDEGRLIALAAGAETASTHPFASAILRGARARRQRPDNVRNATVHAGLGVTALASTGERLVVGSRALLLQEKVSIAVADARVTELEAQGRSVLLVALAGKLVGLVALQDGLRPGARPAVQRLLDARIEPVLLSGEARETCETIGRALDIDHVRPEVLPADRGAEVCALGEGGHVVAVLGHPANDDGALGAADVAIAMGAAGSSPGEWTVQLASDDVRDAALALSIARATRDRARRVFVIALAPLAAALFAIGFGLAPLEVAPVAAAAGVLVAARVR